jgi:nitrite reductase (NO-forming)
MGPADHHAEMELLGAPDVSYTLTTGSDAERLVFYGVGGDIDGQINPTLTADPGQIVQITLINGQPVEHDIVIDELGVAGHVTAMDEEVVIQFRADAALAVNYYCSVPGHRAAGMEGLIAIGGGQLAGSDGVAIVTDPNILPAPIGDREPQLVTVELEAVEVEGQLADGVTYAYFTFNGAVPGPFLRVRVGDTVQLTLANNAANHFVHSIDLHAVNGPGGGAVHTQVEPGDARTFTFTALNPGIYVYHCATGSVPHHISAGMYGLILVEPQGGLPPVDREFYVMQGEIYTDLPFGVPGQAAHDHEALLNEDAEYIVFNGMAGGLAQEDNLLHAEVGETVRIFFGVGGPNYTSSFHVIGEIFDRVYPFGSLTSEVLTDVQTITVAPGGAWIVEFAVQEPGNYILVDHALARLERGLVGLLVVTGEESADVFYEGPAQP